MKYFTALSARPRVVLLVLLGLVFTGLCLANLFAFILVHLLYGLSFSQFGQLDSPSAGLPHVREAMLLLQGVACIGLSASALLVPVVYRQPIRHYFAPRPLLSMWWPLLASGLLICTIPLASGLSSWNATLHLPSGWLALEQWARLQEEHAQQLIQGLTHFHSATQLLGALVVMALLPTIAEELIFRGVLQPLLGRWLASLHAGIWLTALVFSALHVQFLGFVPRLLLGVILGYLYAWSGNIVVPMAAHFTQNAGQLLLLWVTQKGYAATTFSPDALHAWPGSTVVGSSLLTASILYVLHQRFTGNIAPVKAM